MWPLAALFFVCTLSSNATSLNFICTVHYFFFPCHFSLFPSFDRSFSSYVRSFRPIISLAPSRAVSNFCFVSPLTTMPAISFQTALQSVSIRQACGVLLSSPSAARRPQAAASTSGASQLLAQVPEDNAALLARAVPRIERAAAQVRANPTRKTKKKKEFSKTNTGCMMLGETCCGSYRCSAGQMCFEGSCVASTLASGSSGMHGPFKLILAAVVLMVLS